MARDGYQSVKLTLKAGVVEALDSLETSRSEIISKLILQQAESLQTTDVDTKGEPPEALISYVKKRLPEFSRQEAADLIVAILSRIV
jgi:hypothetical protein